MRSEAPKTESIEQTSVQASAKHQKAPKTNINSNFTAPTISIDEVQTMLTIPEEVGGLILDAEWVGSVENYANIYKATTNEGKEYYFKVFDGNDSLIKAEDGNAYANWDQINRLRLKEKKDNRGLEDDVLLSAGDKFVTKFDCYSEKVGTRVVVFERAPKEDFSTFLKKDGEYVKPSKDNVLQRGKCLLEMIKTIAAYHDEGCVTPFVQADNFTIKIQSELVNGQEQEKIVAEFKDNSTGLDCKDGLGGGFLENIQDREDKAYKFKNMEKYDYAENLYAFGGLIFEALVNEKNKESKKYSPFITDNPPPSYYSDDQWIFLGKFLADFTTYTKKPITSKQAVALMQVFVDSLEREDKAIPNYFVAKEEIMKQYPDIVPNKVKDMMLSSDIKTKQQGLNACGFMKNGELINRFVDDPDLPALHALNLVELQIKIIKKYKDIVGNKKEYKPSKVKSAEDYLRYNEDINSTAGQHMKNFSHFSNLSKKMYVIGTEPKDGQKIPVSNEVFDYVNNLVNAQRRILEDPARELSLEDKQKKVVDKVLGVLENGKFGEIDESTYNDWRVNEGIHELLTVPSIFVDHFWYPYNLFCKDKMSGKVVAPLNFLSSFGPNELYITKGKLLKLKELVYVEGQEKPEGKKYPVPEDLYNAMMECFEKRNI